MGTVILVHNEGDCAMNDNADFFLNCVAGSLRNLMQAN